MDSNRGPTTRLNIAEPIHPVHAVLLATAMGMALAALLADITYGNTYQVQWTNFGSWLVFGAVLLSGLALAWALIDRLRADRRRDRGGLVYLGLLALFVFVNLINNFVHAMDAWAKMPWALILSIIASILGIAAVWLGFRGYSRRVAA